MKKVYFILFLLLSGCGVDTNSSSSIIDTDTNTDTNTTSTTDTDTNTTSTTDTDTNTTSTTDTDTNTTSTAGTVENAVFDYYNAIYEENCCRSSSMTNTTPLIDTSDTLREVSDEINGLELRSIYPNNGQDTTTVLYYNDLDFGSSLSGDSTSVYGDNSQFIVTYDLVWVNQSKNVCYVKTPVVNSNLPSCYKIEMNSEDGTSIVPIKVYR